MHLLLITAKIKGGNSGGPVFNKSGYLVGIASELMDSKGNYDNVGYGMAIQASELSNLINHKNCKELDKRNISFVDFEEF